MLLTGALSCFGPLPATNWVCPVIIWRFSILASSSGHDSHTCQASWDSCSQPKQWLLDFYEENKLIPSFSLRNIIYHHSLPRDYRDLLKLGFEIRGLRNSTANRVLLCTQLAHVWSLAPYMVIPSLPGVIPKCRTRSKPWRPRDVLPKYIWR